MRYSECDFLFDCCSCALLLLLFGRASFRSFQLDNFADMGQLRKISYFDMQMCEICNRSPYLHHLNIFPMMTTNTQQQHMHTHTHKMFTRNRLAKLQTNAFVISRLPYRHCWCFLFTSNRLISSVFFCGSFADYSHTMGKFSYICKFYMTSDNIFLLFLSRFVIKVRK